MHLAIDRGEGSLSQLIQIADRLLGRDVGYELLIKTFCANEVSNGLAQLRNDGLIESTGKLWKLTSNLETEDVDIIHVRRLKRLRGELKSEIRLAHEHGRVEDAVNAGRMLEIVQQQLLAAEPEAELAEVQDANS